jgi:3-methyladenine DNA glycosylase AlkD
MLREVGKRVSMEQEMDFLDKYAHKMPRTMLRYAIERMSGPNREKYLSRVG